MNTTNTLPALAGITDEKIQAAIDAAFKDIDDNGNKDVLLGTFLLSPLNDCDDQYKAETPERLALAKSFLSRLAQPETAGEPTPEIPWITHDGGPCPIADEDVAEWEYKDHEGRLVRPTRAPSTFAWDAGTHIAAYRVLRRQPEATAEAEKSFDLNAHVIANGFRPLAEGEQWFRGNEFDKSTLPAGFRPMLMGEEIEAVDEWSDAGQWLPHGPESGNLGVDLGNPAHIWLLHRTHRPLPLVQAEKPQEKSLGQVAEDAYNEFLQQHESDSHEHCMEFAAQAVAQAATAPLRAEVADLERQLAEAKAERNHQASAIAMLSQAVPHIAFDPMSPGAFVLAVAGVIQELKDDIAHGEKVRLADLRNGPRLLPISSAPAEVSEGCVRVHCQFDFTRKPEYQWAAISMVNGPYITHYCDIRLPQEDPHAELKPATFEAHGFTWTKHTPGHPMPCDRKAMVHTIGKDGGINGPYEGDMWNWENNDPVEENPVIGWRYADKPAAAEGEEASPTPSRYRWTWQGITFDFYRLCEILAITHHAQAHAFKKLIRAGRSVKSIAQDIDEAIDALRRWKEMTSEDASNSTGEAAR